MRQSKQIGNLTELQSITRFVELGISVSIPYGDSEKYDYIIDVNGRLYRIQCKHANVHCNENGDAEYFTIKTCWQSGYTKNNQSRRHTYSKEDCDFIVTYYNGKNYFIMLDECSTLKTIRILPPKNCQLCNITLLKDCVDEEVLKSL